MRNKRCKISLHHLFMLLLLGSFTLCLWLGNFSPSLLWGWGDGVFVNAQTTDANQLVRQGIERYEAGDLLGAINKWQNALNYFEKVNNRATTVIVVENLARAFQKLGESESAISYWKRAISYYRQMGNLPQVARMLTEQAQSYNSLGQSRRAVAVLDEAVNIVRNHKDKDAALEAAVLGTLGDAYRLVGDYQQAMKNLDASFKIAQAINNPVYLAASANNLGNVYLSLAQVNYRRANSSRLAGDAIEAEAFRKVAENYDGQAWTYFQTSLKVARAQNDQSGQMRALLNSLVSSSRSKTNIIVQIDELHTALDLLEELPDAQDKVYAAIELADLVQPGGNNALLNQCRRDEGSFSSSRQGWESKRPLNLLNQAVEIARRLQDKRAESYAVGNLGHFYECRGDYQQALKLTQQAQLLAGQSLSAKDSLYLWEWQAGRIFKAQNQEEEAIKSYEQAVATLEGIRSDILIANRDLQFDFRDGIEPIYRELAGLRLARAGMVGDVGQENLKAAIKTIDTLKLAELQNYFGNDCVLAALQSAGVDTVGAKTATAVFNAIILPQQTFIVVTLPNGVRKERAINVSADELRKTINQFRIGLENRADRIYNPTLAQQLYNLIVRPFEPDLTATDVQTLVFIPDGILRSVPMSALHDGEKYLVEKYAIATTPSLNLTDAKTVNHKALRALALGLTTVAQIDGRTFPALTSVAPELQQVKAKIPGSKQLLDNDFTKQRLQQELSKTTYPILHIATHGEFGSVPEDTFLVTGNNDKITITQLEQVIRSVIGNRKTVNLLTLTACETAVGDERAALGLAGVAVQAGVSSTLASLWTVDDSEATVTLVTEFYRSWREGKSKAAALQAAQTKLIQNQDTYTHPADWAPFILIGNWL